MAFPPSGKTTPWFNLSKPRANRYTIENYCPAIGQTDQFDKKSIGLTAGLCLPIKQAALGRIV
ncbi:hypothetical protein [Undibacter mobilis]|uniref:hypothetical protein n=1 Tax=Undibacter mobilis TaxID=2292256 RepID=UPI00143D12BC|nr:hypothetical protein [Undibacter mobilis]